MKGFTYWIEKKLYIALTNECNSISPLTLKGPSFQSFKTWKLAPLIIEPTADDILNEVNLAFDSNKIVVDSMHSEAITYAGIGEPLLRKDVLFESARLIKLHRHGVPLRVRTNGLILADQSLAIAAELKECGIKNVSVSLVSDNKEQYSRIMKPTTKANFTDVCTFIINCAEMG